MTHIKGLVLKISYGDVVTIGEEIRVAAENIGDKKVKLVIDAPRDIPIQHGKRKQNDFTSDT